MSIATRRLLDRAFTSVGVLAIVIMGAALVVILAPIFVRGAGAFVFRGTVEHRKVLLEKFGHGSKAALDVERRAVAAARAPLYRLMGTFEADMEADRGLRRTYRQDYAEFRDRLEELLGPPPGDQTPVLPRKQYGQTRWDRVRIVANEVLFRETWDYSDPTRMGKKVLTPRADIFAGTSLAPAFTYIEQNLQDMLRPRWTVYWQFITDPPLDAHIFGGILPEILGTIYLTLGAMLFAVPLGIISAIYLTEYAAEGRMIILLRTCISTLAGVPSIVFGLFGLAFFINTMHVSEAKSVLAGSLTLALLILPTVIRASEEAIRAVPHTYKEAALSLGAGQWHTVCTVILPAALPGILTGIVISMGRAAGETAPIIFTAAVSVGRALNPLEAVSKPTPALSWNIYNLCTEHEAVDTIRHVQFGMVATLVLIVLILNVAAITLRARIAKKLKG
jgi:phosphate transport system permease protein